MDIKQHLRSVLRDVYIRGGRVAALKKITEWKNKGYLTSDNHAYLHECVTLWTQEGANNDY